MKLIKLGALQALLTLTFLNTSYSLTLNCPEYTAESREYSFQKFNPGREVIENRSYPSNDRVLFRGIYISNNQYNLSKVLSAFFDLDNEWHVGSPIFWAMVNILTGKRSLDEPLFSSGGQLPHSIAKYLRDRNLEKDILSLLKCKGNQFYEQNEAEQLTLQLMNRFFFSEKEDDLSKRYFDMKWEYYYDKSVNQDGYGNNGIEFISSSAYDFIAAIYGPKILVTKDTRNRALDLTFFNFKRNGFYVQTWVDLGEIISPGYLSRDEILGYQERQNDRIRGSAWYTTTPNNPIVYAVYKEQINKKTIALVFSGNKNDLCILQGPDGKFYKCKPYSPSLTTKPIEFPEVSSTPATLVGVVTEDTIDHDIDTLKKAIDLFGINTSDEVPVQFYKSFSKQKIGNKALYFHPVEKIKNYKGSREK